MNYALQKHQSKLDTELQSLYFGGGTPSLLDINNFQAIMNSIKQHISISQDTEVTLEIDPGTFDTNKLNQFKQIGVNRLSMGVQTLNEAEFKHLGRGHEFKDIMMSIDQIYKSEFESNQLSIDLIMGIPHQNVDSYYQSLLKSLDFNAGHRSFYLLTLEQNTPFHRKYAYDSNPLPITDEVANMYKLTHETLISRDFQHYEVSNYTRYNNLESRHNNMYWEGDQEYLAFGCGAASYFMGLRFTRPKTLKQYYRYVDQLLEGKVKEIEEEVHEDLMDKVQTIAMCNLRTQKGLRTEKLTPYYQNPQQVIENIKRKIKLKFGDSTIKYFKLDDPNAIALTPIDGFLVSNTLISDILLMLEE